VAQTTGILFAPDGQPPPDALRLWFASQALPVVRLGSPDELMAFALRGRPRLVVFDARVHPVAALKACARLKRDSYTGIVPAVALSRDEDTAFAAAFDAGADEVLREGVSEAEVRQRMNVLLRRSDRDTLAHPSTRLPGTVEIESEIHRRLTSDMLFAT